ncbi:MAG: hypothetical protein C4337_06255 [Armatimonadota bacterium]
MSLTISVRFMFLVYPRQLNTPDSSVGAMEGWKPPFLSAPEGVGFRAAGWWNGTPSFKRQLIRLHPASTGKYTLLVP